MNGITLTLETRWLNIFKTSILNKKKKKGKFLFFINDPFVSKLRARLRLKFNHLNERKFRHGFNDTINPMYACGTEVETTEQFLLRRHFYSTLRLELFKSLEKTDPNSLILNEND